MKLFDTENESVYYLSMANINFNHLKLRAIVAGSGNGHNDVCRAAGFNSSTFSKWVTGRSRPDPENLYKVLSVCGWTDDQIANLKLVDFYPLV